MEAQHWMGPRGAASRLGINLSELRRLRETGGLPFHPRGNGGYLYEQRSLDAWVAARVSPARPMRLSRYGPTGADPLPPPAHLVVVAARSPALEGSEVNGRGPVPPSSP